MLATSRPMTSAFDKGESPMPKDLPSPEILRKLLRYEPETGKLFWRERTPDMFTDQRLFNSWSAKHANKEAFTANKSGGYKNGIICGVGVSAHRLIWALTYGSWPNGIIDHMNGDTSDNRIVNLRCVSQVENQRNQFQRKDNKSGFTGVHFCKASGKWVAQCYGENSKRIFIGRFSNKSDAIAARMAAQKDNIFTSRHGTPRMENICDDNLP